MDNDPSERMQEALNKDKDNVEDKSKKKKLFDASQFDAIKEDTYYRDKRRGQFLGATSRLGREKNAVQPKPPKDHTVWIYLPFDKGQQEDMRQVAKDFIQEHEQNPRGNKKYKIVEHGEDGNPLQGVKPGDTLYVYTHGAQNDLNRHFNEGERALSPEAREKMDPKLLEAYRKGGLGSISNDELASRMLADGLNPNQVNVKLGICWGVGDRNMELQAARTTETLTKRFAQTLGQQTLDANTNRPPDQQLGLPNHVDGYVGAVLNDRATMTMDGRRHRGANAPESGSQAARPLGKVGFMGNTNKVHPSQIAKLTTETQQYRARDHRLRYTYQQDSMGLHVNLDEQDYERAQMRRDLANPQAAVQRKAQERLARIEEQRRVQERTQMLEQQDEQTLLAAMFEGNVRMQHTMQNQRGGQRKKPPQQTIA